MTIELLTADIGSAIVKYASGMSRHASRLGAFSPKPSRFFYLRGVRDE